jgi:hypothetical protein
VRFSQPCSWGLGNHFLNLQIILKGAFILKAWEIHLFGPLDVLSIHCVPLKHMLHLTQWCSVMCQKNSCLFNHYHCNNNFVQTERLQKWSKQKELPHSWRILNKILLFLCIRWQRLSLWAFLSFDIKIRLWHTLLIQYQAKYHISQSWRRIILCIPTNEHKVVELQFIYIHDPSSMFWRMYTIFWETVIQRNAEN